MTSYPKVKVCLNTSENSIADELYNPCLKWATRFDRGVGYFTSGWLSYNIAGLSDFASRGGKMRLITSPILSNTDSDAIIYSTHEDSSIYKKFEEALSSGVDNLIAEMKADILNAFSWMLFDGIIEMKFAIPYKRLNDGDFHDKFGIFYNNNDALSFSGSINDSIHGFQNYESIKVFSTWSGTKEYVESDIERFNRLWEHKDPNIKIFTTPEAIKQKIFKLRTSERPYQIGKKQKNKWAHQEEAVARFIEKEHGILAMATGTGKTVTAMKIINKLFEDSKIRRVIITMFGNDLLDQWVKQIRANYKGMQIYCHYGPYKDLNKFIMHPDNAILIISRDADNLSKLLDSFHHAPGDYKNDTLFIFDEVHGAGANSFVENLTGRISPYKFRLGLSATPEREYDDIGNDFIKTEIGEVIYEFSLEDAIKKGILCEFDYIPLSYVLTDEERNKKRRIIAHFNAQKTAGEFVDETEMFTQLSRVNKLAINKIPQFENLVAHNPTLLKKCIIFVQEMEYGAILQDTLVKYTDSYHTYYAEDEKSRLEDFAAGKIECLLTCKKISEGIDISSVTNIFLFASDRSKLLTTQRIGRALRLDENNPNKKATIIDFILDDSIEIDDNNADQARRQWLTNLSKTRRLDDEE